MRKGRFPQIIKQYKFDEERNAYLIEVSLDNYDDVYDAWDPAPFKKRFIELDFDDFIVNSSEDIPFKYDINIVLYLPLEKKDENRQKSVVSAFKNYYSYATEKVEIEWLREKKRNFSYLLMSLFFLITGYILQLGNSNAFLEVLKQGVLIGGWVFLWEFITNIFIKRTKSQIRYKTIKRLVLSELKFVYVQSATGHRGQYG